MFERFDEKSRRVIFFARYEASQMGEPYIEPHHFLLGLLREDKGLFALMLPNVDLGKMADSLRANVSGEKISTSVDLPVSMDGKRVLALAAEESEGLGQPVVGTRHLLLGLLRQPSAVRDLLEKMGLALGAVREVVKKQLSPAPAPGNAQIIGLLRNEFKPMLIRLTPEVEPAVEYRLEPAK